MADPREEFPMTTQLSENTINRANQGLKRFNILKNNSSTSVGQKRQSIVLNDEYDSSDSNIVGVESFPESPAASVIDVEEAEEVEQSPLSAGSSKSTGNDTIQYEKKVATDSAASQSNVYKHVTQSKVRFKKDGKMRSNFGDLNFIARETIFDREIHFGAKFYGLYVACWIAIAFFGVDVVCGYHRSHGSLFSSEIVRLMLKDLWKVALTDLAMYLSMYVSVIIQLLIKHNIIRWKYTGFALQTAYEIALLYCPLSFADRMNYPWIAQIFIMLHSVVMLMKVHSYAFFNGYLWEITNELKFSTVFIKKKDYLPEKIEKALNNSIEFCNSEISSQKFPKNISFSNFLEYSFFPVLVYQNSYPRNDKIRWGYLFTKVAGIFGVIILMIAIAQHRLYPIVIHCLEIQKTTSLSYRLKEYPFILIETIPPFLTVYLLVFYLIWELILNAIAELSRFADREFYGYWWNSVDWNEYARDWNVPVHKFLLRHVYHSSISAFKVNKTAATFFTFLLSSLIHELAMYVIFKKVRFYLLCLQMSQLSLVQLSKTKWMRGRNVLGNCIFWFGVVFGPSLMCTMYLVF